MQRQNTNRAAFLFSEFAITQLDIYNMPMIQNIIMTQIEREGIIYQSRASFFTPTKFYKFFVTIVLIPHLGFFFILFWVFVFGKVSGEGGREMSFLESLGTRIMGILFFGVPAYLMTKFLIGTYSNNSEVIGPGMIYLTSQNVHFVDKNSYEYTPIHYFKIYNLFRTPNGSTFMSAKTGKGNVKAGEMDNIEEFRLLLSQQINRSQV